MDSKGTLFADQQQFGPNLKAAPYLAVGKNVIFVPGYYKKSQPRSPMKQSPKVVSSDTVGEGQSASQVKEPQPDMGTEISKEAINCDTFQKSKISTNREFIAPISGASSNKSESIPIISFLQWIFLERLIMICFAPNSQRLRPCPKCE